MKINYEQIASLAESLLKQNGRLVEVVRYGKSEGNSKPWQGDSDSRSNPDAQDKVVALFVPPSGASSLGLKSIDRELLKRISQICIVAPGVSDPPFDLATANELIDGDSLYKIAFVEKLRPAETTLLYFIGVER